MPMLGSDFNLTGHVINYNIHMDLQTTSEDLKYRAFPATLDEHDYISKFNAKVHKIDAKTHLQADAVIEAPIDAKETPLNAVEIAPLIGIETRVPASMGVISLDVSGFVKRTAKSDDLDSIESTREYHVNSYMEEELAYIASFSGIQGKSELAHVKQMAASWFRLRYEAEVD
ncbi:hypothetical protein ACLOJK_020300 [Asimina triloba]